jgi:hypothetical protein
LDGFIYPNKSITRSEIEEVLARVDEGEELSDEQLDNVLSTVRYPTRAAVSSLLTKKFLPKFIEYFYMQDGHKQYYEELLDRLRGERFTDQYELIISQIQELERRDHGSAYQEGIDPFWLRSFLKKLLNGAVGEDNDS